MAKSIPTVSAAHPLAKVAKTLALLKRAADRIAARRGATVAAGLTLLEGGDSNSVRTTYGTVGKRSGRRIVTVTCPQVLARIEEKKAEIKKMEENAVAAGKANVTFAADTVALTGCTLPD